MAVVGRLLSRSGFGASVAVLVTGTAVGQALTLAAAPVLTRLYQPSDLGVLALYTSIVSVLAVVVCLRFEVAIPLPEDDDEATRLAWLALAACALSTAVVAIVVFMLAIPLRSPLRLGPEVVLFGLLPLSVLGIGVLQTLSFWALRHERFRPVGAASAAQAAAQASLQLGLGAAGFGPAGLLIGHAGGRVGGALVLWTALRHTIRRVPTGSLRTLLRSAGRYRRFPLLTTWSSLINSASAELPIMLLSFAFGSGVVGLFALTSRVLQAPMALLGQAIGQVYYASSARHPDRAILLTTTRVMLRRLTALASGPLLLVVVCGPVLFELAFGSQWRQAGAYAQWLTPWLLVVFIASPISTLVFVLERQRPELLFQVSLILSRTAALGIGAVLGDADLAIHLFAVVSAGMWAGYLAWLISLVGIPLTDLLRLIGARLFRAAGLALPAIVAVVLEPAPAVLLLAIGGSSALIGADALLQARRAA